MRNHHDIKKITCIQLSGEFPDFCYRLVMPGYGMPFIGTVLAEDGYDVKAYMEHVKAPEGSRIAESDLVKMSEFIAPAVENHERIPKRCREKYGAPFRESPNDPR